MQRVRLATSQHGSDRITACRICRLPDCVSHKKFRGDYCETTSTGYSCVFVSLWGTLVCGVVSRGTVIHGAERECVFGSRYGDGQFQQPADRYFRDGVAIYDAEAGGTFLNAGATAMANDHFGIGVDISWRATHAAYAGLRLMPLFYDIDGVWTPMKTKHFEPEIHAGIGGMKLDYTYSQTSCNQLSGCATATEGVTSSSHFQGHFSAAARFYLTDHVFIRPSVDTHLVSNLFQYGRDLVPEYSVGIGYSFGRE